MGRIARLATGAVDPGRSLRAGLPREVTATAATEIEIAEIATVAGGASTDTRRRETGGDTTEAATEVGG